MIILKWVVFFIVGAISAGSALTCWMYFLVFLQQVLQIGAFEK